MRMKLFIPFGIMMVIFLLWKPLDASACSCMMPPPPEDAMNEADAVFTGEVVEVIENGKLIRGSGKTVHFKVDKAWKGTDDSEMVITTGFGGGDCGIPFEKGQKYLVYASTSDMYVSNTLSTTICHRTTEIAYATEDLNAIGEGQEVSGQQDSADEVDQSFPWWAFVVFILGLVAIFILFKVKNNKNKARG
ncbi:hypothetical protein MHZ92_10210 [Sporosarcina sp. ACRSL]|uniref:hypothetical protein n=1 Tax=Sporosarcina sp. ACRSL TaxID=2918215 RepID=UPI001EF691C8|nr:hypothetical protein [Sporosarcina sp. ACRSL]MCG7344509.1 hypothetical protein [Sporosarcina sp. ACRSL]